MKISVVIPTHSRLDRLNITLKGYCRQVTPRDEFEVIVVEDGVPGEARATVEKYGALYVDESHRPGPASARNLGIVRARAPLVLLSGNDMVPADDFIKRHLDCHLSTPGGAVLGHVAWHKNCKVTPFMRFLVDSGGQFSFSKIKNPENCGYRFFYTANISMNKHWLIAEPFDEKFPWAAMEDIELGYRLSRRGLVIRYRPEALVYHFHQVDIRSFRERMRYTGASACYFVDKFSEDKKLRWEWLPFRSFPFGVTAVTMIGRLMYSLPVCWVKWFGFLCMGYAEGVARATQYGMVCSRKKR